MLKFLSHMKGSKINLGKAFKNKFVNQIYLKLYSQYNVGLKSKWKQTLNDNFLDN